MLITFLSLLSLNAYSISMIAIDGNNVVVCPAKLDTVSLPTFLESDCSIVSANEVDPQNTAIWIKVRLNIPQELLANGRPHGIYISGKTSSKVYFNRHYIGQNGTPSLNASEEFPGNIDTLFYIKDELAKPGTNHLILLLSSHHGFLKLANPINFIGYGDYSAGSSFVKHAFWQAFIPFGFLILAILYFSISCMSSHQRQANRLLLLMSIFGAGQLVAETSRMLFSYSYPLQDFRLLLIVSFSFGFGACLLAYVVTKFIAQMSKKWITYGMFFTLSVIFLVPGFDIKTAIAVLIPTLISTSLIGIRAIQQQELKLWILLVVFISITITISLTLVNFHDLLYYYIIALVIGFLFTQQALELNRERDLRKKEEQQVAQLRFKLELNQQKLKPTKIKISSAGKIEVISIQEIYYCKASGDYVEIYLKNGKERLYSGNLKELEKQLPSSFFRVHRSYIVNMAFIETLKGAGKNTSGSGVLILEGGSEVPVSRRIMPMVRHAVGNNQSNINDWYSQVE